MQPPKLLIFLLRQATVSATSSLIRRDIVEQVGGFEEDFYGMFEDQAFAAKSISRHRCSWPVIATTNGASTLGHAAPLRLKPHYTNMRGWIFYAGSSVICLGARSKRRAGARHRGRAVQIQSTKTMAWTRQFSGVAEPNSGFATNCDTPSCSSKRPAAGPELAARV